MQKKKKNIRIKKLRKTMMFRCCENLGLEEGNLSFILMPRNREI